MENSTAPASVESIIADSISNLDGAEPIEDSGSDDSAEMDASGDDTADGTTETLESTTDEAAPVAEAVVEDALATELGLKPGSKNNRIPYARVQKILEKQKAEAAKEIAAREERLAKLAKYDSPDFENALESWKIADQDPERFLNALADTDPRYAKLIRQAQAQQAQEQAQAAPQGSIEPDVLLPNGDLGYSPEAVQRMVDQRAQLAIQQMEAKFNEQFGPMARDYKQAQMMQGAHAKASQRLSVAAQWPGFKENQAEIRAAFAADKNLTLEQAYIKVVTPKMQTSRDEMRKQLIAEINQKPRGAAGAIGGAPRAAVSEGPRDIEDIIRDSIKGLE